MPYVHPLISETTTDIWLTFWNTTFKAALEAGVAGGSGWPVEFTGNGRIITDSAADGAAQETGSPSPNIVIPDGSQYVVGGVLQTADGDQTLGPISPNFTGWLVPVVTFNETSEVYDWTLIEYVTRPALGAGVLGKVTTGATNVTALDTSEAESDVIPTMPLLLARIAAGGGGGAAYWGALFKSASLLQTIEQMVNEKIALAIAGLGSSDPTEFPEMKHVLQELGGHAVGIVETNPGAANRLRSTPVVLGVSGDGSSGSIDDFAEGTATVESETRTVGP